jgi:hypothetical protein
VFDLLREQVLSESAVPRGKKYVVAGGRYELYSNHPLQIQAVAASIATPPQAGGGRHVAR